VPEPTPRRALKNNQRSHQSIIALPVALDTFSPSLTPSANQQPLHFLSTFSARHSQENALIDKLYFSLSSCQDSSISFENSHTPQYADFTDSMFSGFGKSKKWNSL